MASDYAMQAKARSLFASHFTIERYQSMAALKDVPSIANYLKNDERYSQVLDTIKEREVHREVLEQKIRLLGQVEFIKLMRYVKVGRTNFFKFYVKRREIEQILYSLHSINSQVPFKLEYYIDKLNDLMDIDVNRLARLTSFRDLHAYLETTPYKGVLKNLLDDDVSIAQCEDLLNHHYRKYLEKLVSKEPNAKEVQSLFNMDDELTTVEHIYRLKKNYNMSAERILPRIRYKSYLISQNQMKQWVQSYDAEGFMDAFKKSAYSRFIQSQDVNSIESFLNSIRYKICEHHLRFATNTNMTLIAYMNLVHFEISNIVDIIEGVRYGISTDKILSLLTQ